MFSKTAVFPKVTDPQAARGQRPGNFTVQSSSLTSGSADASHAPGGSSPASSPSAPVPTPPESTTVPDDAAESAGSRLIVGPHVKLKGAEILDCDTLVVEGRVEATMDSRVIRIAENGSFAGTVGIDVAEVRGRFEGELTARSQLVIHATGRVSGKIRYGKILIEEGGEISGDVQSIASAKEAGRPASRDDNAGKVAIIAAS